MADHADITKIEDVQAELDAVDRALNAALRAFPTAAVVRTGDANLGIATRFSGEAAFRTCRKEGDDPVQCYLPEDLALAAATTPAGILRLAEIAVAVESWWPGLDALGVRYRALTWQISRLRDPDLFRPAP